MTEVCFSPEQYNNLPTVEEANLAINRNSFSEFFQKAVSLARIHGISEGMGIRLAHKHVALDSDSKMIESLEINHGIKQMVTRPCGLETLASPSSWIYNGGDFQPFEFSNDSSAEKFYDQARGKLTDFIPEFFRLAKEYQMEHLFAPSILHRSWDSDFAGCGEVYLLEKSTASPSFASIIAKADPVEFDEGSSIRTAWTFEEVPMTVGCRQIFMCQDSGGAFGHPRVIWGHNSE